LIDSITRQLYEKICIGLFEEHKVVYAFIIASSIQRKLGLIEQPMWNFLLRGAGLFDKTEMPPKPEFLVTVSRHSWELLYQLSKFNYSTKKVKLAGSEDVASVGEASDETKAQQEEA